MQQRNNAERVLRAVAAAQAVAGQHGIPTGQPQVLHDCNNVVVHFAGSAVVAKVCPAAAAGWSRLEREVAVARHLVLAGAPVAGPTSELPAGPHLWDGQAISFWRYHDHDAGADPCTRVVAATLAKVHQALAGYQGPLASFLDRRVRRTGDAMADPTYGAALGADNHAFLQRQYVSIMSSLEARKLDSRPLHGDPHRRNFLAGQDGCLMIDFESVCSGPVEWDLSALPGGGAGVFEVDEELLAVLRRLRSLCVAVWCAGRATASREMAQAARVHLDLLRSAA